MCYFWGNSFFACLLERFQSSTFFFFFPVRTLLVSCILCPIHEVDFLFFPLFFKETNPVHSTVLVLSGTLEPLNCWDREHGLKSYSCDLNRFYRRRCSSRGVSICRRHQAEVSGSRRYLPPCTVSHEIRLAETRCFVGHRQHTVVESCESRRCQVLHNSAQTGCILACQNLKPSTLFITATFADVSVKSYLWERCRATAAKMLWARLVEKLEDSEDWLSSQFDSARCELLCSLDFHWCMMESWTTKPRGNVGTDIHQYQKPPSSFVRPLSRRRCGASTVNSRSCWDTVMEKLGPQSL